MLTLNSFLRLIKKLINLIRRTTMAKKTTVKVERQVVLEAFAAVKQLSSDKTVRSLPIL